jgi:hypothetical protein
MKFRIQYLLIQHLFTFNFRVFSLCMFVCLNLNFDKGRFKKMGFLIVLGKIKIELLSKIYVNIKSSLEYLKIKL